MTLDELEKLANKYLETLQDTHRDEWYATDRTFSAYGINYFIKWLRTEQAGL